MEPKQESALQMKLEIEMGTASAPGSAPAMLDVEELLATRLLVQGNSGSGKSHLLRRLLEQSAPHVQQVIIDPEGEFASLSDRYGHVVIDGERSLVELEHVEHRGGIGGLHRKPIDLESDGSGMSGV